ncbi:MAG: hypothetical protein U0361_13445 [Nitrospiraceae bacterium]
MIPLKGTTYPGNWERLYAASTAAAPASWVKANFYVHWQFANERFEDDGAGSSRPSGWYVATTAPGVNPRSVVAAIDATFANSFAETRTSANKPGIAGWVARSGALLDALIGCPGA